MATLVGVDNWFEIRLHVVGNGQGAVLDFGLHLTGGPSEGLLGPFGEDNLGEETPDLRAELAAEGGGGLSRR